MTEPRPYFSSPRALIMLFLVLSGIGIVGLIGVGCAINANSCILRPKKQTSTDPRVLYMANCASCHGRTGAGVKKHPTLIAGDAAKLSFDEVQRWVRRGKRANGMPAYGNVLNAQQIRAVSEYVFFLRGDEPPPAPTPTGSPSAPPSASPSPSRGGP